MLHNHIKIFTEVVNLDVSDINFIEFLPINENSSQVDRLNHLLNHGNHQYLGFMENKSLLEIESKNKHIESANWENININIIDEDFLKNKLNNLNDSASLFSTYDVITNYIYDFKKENAVLDYYKFYVKCDDLTNINALISCLKFSHIEFYELAEEILNGSRICMYSDYIMKKEIFEDFTAWKINIYDTYNNLCNSTKKTYSNYKRNEIAFFEKFLLTVYIEHLLSHDKTIAILQLPSISYEDIHTEAELLPAYSDNNIPIVVVCSNYYAPYLGVFLQSLFNTCNSCNNYDIIVLQKELSTQNKNTLSKMCSRYENISIRFFNPTHRLNNSVFHIAQTGYCEEAYYRIFSPWYLQNYDKAIVMDIDILIRKDLAELFHKNIEGKLAAGVKDIVFLGMLNGWAVPDTKTYASKEMKLKNPWNYLNTGVLLMNLKLIRETYSEGDLLEMAVNSKFRCQEQDILNIILEDKVLFLGYEWNCYVRTGDFVIEGIRWAPKSDFEQYNGIADNPYISHYVAQPKPWLDPSISMGIDFWLNARETPFYEIILSNLLGTLYGSPIYDLRQRTEKLEFEKKREGITIPFPIGSKRRKIAKKIYEYLIAKKTLTTFCFPKKSKRRELGLKIFYFLGRA